jgi:hypothetical protein
MIGISGDCVIWIYHLLFTISRTRPEMNLRKQIIENRYAEAEGMIINHQKISFTKNPLVKFYSVFFDHEMRDGLKKLCVFYCSIFVYSI